jgi:hypothetical protein
LAEKRANNNKKPPSSSNDSKSQIQIKVDNNQSKDQSTLSVIEEE